MPYTNAEKQKRARDKRAATLKRYEAALREIAATQGGGAAFIANRALHIEVL